MRPGCANRCLPWRTPAPTQRVGIAFGRLLQFARVPESAVQHDAGGGSRRMLTHEQELYTVVEPRALLRQIVDYAAPD